MLEKINIVLWEYRTSRLGGFFGNYKEIIKNPFGLGLNYKNTTRLYETPNGMMVLEIGASFRL